MTDHTLRPLSLQEFLTQPIEARAALLGNWILERQFILVVGEAGAGKSLFAYTLGLAIAAGSEAFGWAAPAKRRVAVLDGEMSDQTIAVRLGGLLLGMDVGDGEADLNILTRDQYIRHGESFPDLRHESDARRLLDMFPGASVLIVDNLNCCFGGGNESDTRFWVDIERFGFLCRDRKMTLILLHHTTKSHPDSPAGSSKNERVPEGIVVLTKLPGTEGKACHFNLRFKKMRELTSDTQAFSAELQSDEHGAARWHTGEPQLEDGAAGALRAEAVRLRAEGLPVREVSKRTGVPRSTVSRWSRSVPCPTVPIPNDETMGQSDSEVV